MIDKIYNILHTFVLGVLISVVLIFICIVSYALFNSFVKNPLFFVCSVIVIYIIGYIGRKIGDNNYGK